MSTVHLTLQGKGGVGKSVVATLLAQYLRDKGIAAKCFDADPLNQTLAGFAGLGVTKVDLMETTEKGRRINPRRFDDLVEQIALQPGENHVIVDTGSSSFVALVHYLVSNDVAAVLSQAGHELVVHTVVTGGQALLDTLHGVAQLVKQLVSAS
jgi:MinD-like ATPase involved in chromosome partitioning or flagellar assembly